MPLCAEHQCSFVKTDTHTVLTFGLDRSQAIAVSVGRSPTIFLFLTDEFGHQIEQLGNQGGVQYRFEVDSESDAYAVHGGSRLFGTVDEHQLLLGCRNQFTRKRDLLDIPCQLLQC